ncbi:MAG: flagellar biosynthesis anti-sigma factor FlgM [Proteobacteria bacterium]|nr:flagellar biosynthesis anti-sigma factor FlgM [Pseudomonadota bacterium]MBU1611879.1 flagellar biosynthesis anti-sigma factor FlgM [Pseudomonadota bacterium]
MSANEQGGYQRPFNIMENAQGSVVAPENMEAQERAERVQLLKAQIKAGTYRADIKDIAMQLAAAMDPLM